MITKNQLFNPQLYEQKTQELEKYINSFQNQRNFIFPSIDLISISSYSSTISAISSNEIENIKTLPTSKNNSLKQQVATLLNQNYNNQLILIKKQFNQIQITPSTILNLHKKLFEGYEKIDQKRNLLINPGNYKVVQNYIIGANREVLFTPPSPTETPLLLQQLCDWYNQENNFNPILKSIIFIFDFIKTHPFADGNGRVSRLLTNLLFLKNGFNFLNYVPFEQFVLKDKNNYMDSIFYSQQGWLESQNDYSPFINFHFKILEKCYNSWTEIIDVYHKIQSGNLNKIAQTLLIIENLRQNGIMITKSSIKSRFKYFQLQIKETTLKDIIFNLSNQNVLILMNQNKMSYYDINYQKFDQYYDKYINLKTNSPKSNFISKTRR